MFYSFVAFIYTLCKGKHFISYSMLCAALLNVKILFKFFLGFAFRVVEVGYYLTMLKQSHTCRYLDGVLQVVARHKYSGASLFVEIGYKTFQLVLATWA